MSDLIRRQDAIDAVRKELVCDGRHETHDKTCRFIADVILSALPSAKGGDAEMNEVKPQYMQSSPNNGADLIRRSDAIETAYQLRHKPNDAEWTEWLKSFNAIPSAEPPYKYSEAYVEQIRTERDILQDMVNNMAETKTGEWDDIGGFIRWGCPFCHHAYESRSNYCPNCGAKMEGGDDE